ncbi:Long-chain-alcohol O-fatty-acyltransferase [Capsicum annuum]|uniref:Long-chain-alcohol O-fatty-acyltransferase n=1 Tax=Capsicum annuum TaxID=4072 RepID=A0A1U8H5J7_CAPAN|nr:long-chain-alcohol O-fatty-acyltransferase [Capsicum annuum]KAF3670089.1 Long-chain-alcohol O-fatty-acyltransferase [Capsicum annuum]PHT79387.1 Long-chain-alcohol O-fatty-acyltransferase [Capsicum annuum]
MDVTVELQNFIRVWFAAIGALCYCYYCVTHIPTGILRLLFVLPVIYFFLVLPLDLSSFHLGAPTIFYLVWLANFKLLLFCFDRGPLSSYSSLPLLHFLSIALLPVKPKHGIRDGSRISSRPRLFWGKIILLGAIIGAYSYREFLPSHVILVLYCIHIYIAVELVLAITVVPVRALLGLEIEPQFNDPYLATSLQDFWGRRWNLMVPGILRPAVYFPISAISARVLGKELAKLPAIFSTFLVSGLMHELIYYYLSRARPTWEVTWFFVLHGICLCIEVVVKKYLGGVWQMNRVVSGVLTLAFVAWTGNWLFFPQIIRNGLDQKAINEYYVLVDLVKDKLLSVFGI